jgi:plastocyanin
MRFNGWISALGALALGACAGGEKNPADTTTVKIDTSAAATATTTTPTTTATGAMAPITGATHEIKMIGDVKGYRFEPASITVKAGDGVKFTVVSGGPHNVAFDAASITDPAVRAQLDANMGTDKMAELSSALKMNPGETATISFANIKPGIYEFHCTPHLALGMKGTITVQ